MNARTFIRTGGLIAALMLAGCATKPYDYSNFHEHPPRSILILPPLNESTAVNATYSYLSTVTFPVAELGYYVYPVAVVDQLFKENGMPTAGEMHQAPLNKILEIIGADAVLYITVEQYGSKYQVVSSTTIVRVKGRLVDTRTGLLLWAGQGAVEQRSGSGGGLADLITAAVTQVVNSGIDAAHDLCPQANSAMLCTPHHGLLYGPYNPQYGKDK